MTPGHSSLPFPEEFKITGTISLTLPCPNSWSFSYRAMISERLCLISTTYFISLTTTRHSQGHMLVLTMDVIAPSQFSSTLLSEHPHIFPAHSASAGVTPHHPGEIVLWGEVASSALQGLRVGVSEVQDFQAIQIFSSMASGSCLSPVIVLRKLMR